MQVGQNRCQIEAHKNAHILWRGAPRAPFLAAESLQCSVNRGCFNSGVLRSRVSHKSRTYAEGQEFGGGLDPKLEAAVPADQRPVNELGQLREGQLYSWATLELRQYAKRLGIVWGAMFLLISGPVAYQTFDPSRQPIEWAVAGCFGSLMIVALIVLRIYLGWAYVGERLLSAAVPYEESGWYDGQTFVKPPEVLARDRLLGSYEVKPKLARLKRTLFGTGGALFICIVLLTGLPRFAPNADAIITRSPRMLATGEGLAFSQKVKRLTDLRNNDDLAAEEALAQRGMPGYCSDRYFRAAAGGQYCQKFDTQRAK